MKRYEIWLGVVLGITFGLLAGFYLGRSFPDEIASGEAARRTETPSQIGTNGGSGDAGATAGISTSNWVKSYTSRFENAPVNQPTPGLTEAIADALREEGPYDQARMLLLVEMMRKEDFPIALEVLRKAKTHINRGSIRGSGPPVWIAFWQRFGERDPATALAKALECGDLDYEDRRVLEKHLFTGMARSNARAAAEAFLAHPELPNRAGAAEGLAFEWAKSDPKAASEWAQTSLEGAARDRAIFAVAWGVSSNFDISGGNDFVKSLPNGPAQASALVSVKYQISSKPYLPAHQLLEVVTTTRTLGVRDRQFEAQMAARCAASDPHAAANFFSQPLPGDAENDFAELKVVSAQWIRRDPKQAENWAKGQEGTPHYEVVAGEFARAAQERNDEAGTQRWLDAIAAQRKEIPPR